MHIFSTVALTLLPCLISQKVSLLGIINNTNSYDACALFIFLGVMNNNLMKHASCKIII